MARRDLKEEVLARVRGEQMIELVRGMGFDVTRSGSEYKILCPFHDDHRPSLGINPTKKEGGIFKCFACGFGGNLFKFVGEYHGMTNFREQLELVAGMVGIPTGQEPIRPTAGAKPEQRPTQKPARTVETMTALEVLEVYEGYKAHAEKPGPWAEKLGVSVEAMEMIGAIVAPSFDRMVLVVPMRDPSGALCSLRFRDFETKRRWSVDVKDWVDGQRVQLKTSRSGLMSYDDFFDPDIAVEWSITFVIEGETDLLSAITLMLREYGTETIEWPARWAALPGVGSCHDMVLESRLSPSVVAFFDDDEAARRAMFDHRPMMRVEGSDRRVPNLDADMQPGLLRRLSDRGHSAIGLFPPKADSKFDLRDWIRSGLTWPQLEAYLLNHGTKDFRGALRTDDRPSVETKVDGPVEAGA